MNGVGPTDIFCIEKIYSGSHSVLVHKTPRTWLIAEIIVIAETWNLSPSCSCEVRVPATVPMHTMTVFESKMDTMEVEQSIR
jgi:hypothetical protein